MGKTLPDNDRPSVWVVNFAGHNYTDAERWGELKYVTKGYVSLGHLDRLVYQVVESLEESRPTDWLIPSGLLILNVLASVFWYEKHGALRLLMWDRKNDSYMELNVDTEHLTFLRNSLTNAGVRSESGEGSSG